MSNIQLQTIAKLIMSGKQQTKIFNADFVESGKRRK